MQRVQWLGVWPCPEGQVLKNGQCTPENPIPSSDFPTYQEQQADLTAVLRDAAVVQPQPPVKKKDNTAFWVLGGVIGLGVLYYAVQ